MRSAIGVRSGGALQRAVLLSGDAGVGKTRLLTELRDVAFDTGWQVETGRAALRTLRVAMPVRQEADVAELRQRRFRPTV